MRFDPDCSAMAEVGTVGAVTGVVVLSSGRFGSAQRRPDRGWVIVFWLTVTQIPKTVIQKNKTKCELGGRLF